MTIFSVCTWNINGIRSNSNFESKLRKDHHVVCYQETKVTRDLLAETTAFIDGFSSYFSFSRKRSGYSGVASYCHSNCAPIRAEEGLSGIFSEHNKNPVDQYANPASFSSDELKDIDSEGRCVLTEHQIQLPDGSVREVVVFNLYVPRVDPEKPERHVFKLRFLELIQLRAEAIVNAGKFVILMGDFNIAHRRIDHCDGEKKEDFEENPCRQWLTQFLGEEPNPRFVDLFRKHHPTRQRAYTCWNTYINARSNNYGTRIDYIFCDSEFAQFCYFCDIEPDVTGSDHCPVVARFKVEPLASEKLPSFCSRFYKEFSGRQQKLSNFVIRGEKKCEVLAGQRNPMVSEVNQECRAELLVTEKSTRGEKRPSNGQQTLLGFFSKKVRTEEKSKRDELGSLRITDSQEMFITKEEERDVSATASQVQSAAAWKNLLKGPPKAPKCKGHSEDCLLRTVKKKGANCGKQFWVCPRGEGHVGDPGARCDFFQWVK